jgi:hypothetical protein
MGRLSRLSFDRSKAASRQPPKVDIGTHELLQLREASGNAIDYGEILASLLPSDSTNQRFPSGPATMPMGLLFLVGIGNSEVAPDGVMRPILLPKYSVNHRLLSGPRVMLPREPALFGVGIGNSSTTPAVVIRPIWLALAS